MPYSLYHHNTFGIHATCDGFAEYHSQEECLQLAEQLRQSQQAWLPIGRGSNLLFVAPHYAGYIVHNAIKGIECMEESNDEVIVRIGGGEIWDNVVEHCVEQGWYGLENLSLIPGEVGAAAVQNIGAYGEEVGTHIVRVEGVYVLPEVKAATIERDACQYAYRSSIFKHNLKDVFLVTHVWLRLSKNFVPKLTHKAIVSRLAGKGITPQEVTATELRRSIIEIRQEKLPDPEVTGNAGSFFMNPVVPEALADSIRAQYPDLPCYPCPSDTEEGYVKIPAAWLIEKCGWKGKSLGPAGVNPLQPLVLTNNGTATGADIVALANAIQHDVKLKFSIELHPEVRYIS